MGSRGTRHDKLTSLPGLVAGGNYYTVTAPGYFIYSTEMHSSQQKTDGSVANIIQKVVDQWGEKTNVSIQVSRGRGKWGKEEERGGGERREEEEREGRRKDESSADEQVTQELQHRSWYFSPRRKQLPR